VAITIGARPGSKTVTPNINVTPLVDVVLVLLIIFLVVTPLMSKTFWVHLPKQEKEEITPEQLDEDPTPPLVLRVGAGDTIQVNGVDIGFDELSERLKRMFAARDDHILFFDADDAAAYGFAVAVLDQAREGGAVTIAPLTQALAPATHTEPGAEPTGDAGAPLEAPATPVSEDPAAPLEPPAG
jgi:biopolymer transport protein ExbD/biopolymer transport protein TolR